MMSFSIFFLLFICYIEAYKSITNNDKEDNASNIITSNVVVVDSDNLYIEKRSSLLPIENAGIGVFAKVNISNDTIICEYRGPIISEEYYSIFNYNDKLFNINNINGKEYKIIVIIYVLILMTVHQL